MRLITIGLLALVFGAGHATEELKLNAAQILIYDTPQLAGLKLGDQLRYAFTSDAADAVIEDRVVLKVAEVDGERRTLSADFLSGENKISMVDFPSIKGNPLLMAALMRDVIALKKLTSGGTAYFRNKLRYALAQASDPVDDTLMIEGKSYAGLRITIKPFIEDPYIERFKRFEQREYSFFYSAELPGYLGEITITTPAYEDSAKEIDRYRFSEFKEA